MIKIIGNSNDDTNNPQTRYVILIEHVILHRLKYKEHKLGFQRAKTL